MTYVILTLLTILIAFILSFVYGVLNLSSNDRKILDDEIDYFYLDDEDEVK